MDPTLKSNSKPILKTISTEYSADAEMHSAEINQLEVAESQKIKTETYKKKKGTAGVKGQFNEIKLAMLFYLRLQNSDKFHLASNMENAGAFDDVVFKYQVKDDNDIPRSKTVFLQAKHSDDSGKRIYLKNLLASTGDFSLKKYFESYREIKRKFNQNNGLIFNGKFDDCSFIIFTNYVLDPKPERFNENHISNPARWAQKAADGYVTLDGQQSKQLNVDAEINQHIINTLSCSLLQLTSDNIKIDNPSVDMNKLANNVLVKGDSVGNANEWVKLSEVALTGQADKFMASLRTKLLEISPQKNLQKIRFQIEGFPRFSLPTSDRDITEDEVKEYLRNLDFVFGQANESKLDEVIKGEIKKAYCVDDEESNTIFESVRTQVETWWKCNESDNDFLTEDTKFVESARASISYLKLSAAEKFSRRGVEIAGVKFNENAITELKAIIDQKQILNIVADKETTLLSSIKTCQTLDSQFGDHSYIYMDVNHILNIRDHVLRVFRSIETTKFLVMEINSKILTEGKWTVEHVKTLQCELLQIIKQNSRKHIITITEKDECIANELEKDTKIFHKFCDTINLNYLTLDSQKRLLDNEITLQGKRIQMSELIVIEDKFPNIQIGSKTLISLIRNDKLTICKAPLSLSDLDAAYTKLYKEMPIHNLIQMSSENNVLFVISGIIQMHQSSLRDKLIHHLNITDDNVEKDFMKRIAILPERYDHKTIIIIPNHSHADPLKEFKTICSNIQSKIVYWVEVTPGQAYLKQVHDPDFYIKRRFSYRTKTALKLELIWQKTPPAKFIFADFSHAEKVEKLIVNLKPKFKENFTENCNNGTIIFANSESSAKSQFEKLEQNNKNVHWLKIDGNDDDEQLLWEKSYGTLDHLRRFIDDDRSEIKLYTEEEFSKEIPDKVTIIADEPGMGKTTSLTSVAQQMQDKNWIFRINFLDCNEAIQELPANLTLEGVCNFVSTATSTDLKNDFGKNIFLYKLASKEHQIWPILILLDGFDEISEDWQARVIPLLKFIVFQTSARLWVTTRLHKMELLENNLSVFATKFEPLDSGKQKQFLEKFWENCLGRLKKRENIRQNISLYATRLLENSDIIWGNISSVMGVPLQLRLFAEGLMEDVVYYLNEGHEPNIENLNILKVYRKFITRKYDIFATEKIRIGEIPALLTSIHNRGFDKHHKSSAMHLLFPETDLLYSKKLKKEQGKDLLSVGIIQSIVEEDKPHFIHRTFAEYFAAQFLASCLKEKEKNPIKYEWTIRFLTKHIFEGRNNVIREFLDHMLSEKSPIHIATLADKISDIIESSKDETQGMIVDNLGRTALHLAARDGRLTIVKVLLDSGYDAVNSDALGKTPLHYATVNRHQEVVKHLLSYNADIDIGDNVFATPLHADMEIGNNLLRDEYSTSTLVTFVNRNDTEGKTAFNYATENNDWTIACSLVLHGARISFGIEQQIKNITSHVIAYYEYDIVEGYCNTDYVNILGLLLINYLPAIYFNNINYSTDKILPIFVYAHHTKVIDAIVRNLTGTECINMLKSLASNIENTNNCSDEDNLKVAKYIFGKCNHKPLLRILGLNAARQGNLETLKYILKHKMKNNLGMYMLEAIECGQQNIVMYCSDYITKVELNYFLYRAVSYRKLGIVKYLIEYGADVNTRYVNGKTLIQHAVDHLTIAIPYLLKKCAGSIISKLEHPIHYFTKICHDPFDRRKTVLDEVMNNLCHIAEELPHLSGLKSPEKVAGEIISHVQNDINCINEQGTTLLHIAVSFQMSAFVYYLIEHGADVNIKDREGRTPLHKAVQAYCQVGKNNETIMCLITHGAIYDEIDDKNYNVFDYFSQSETSTGHDYELLKLIDMLFINFINNFEELMKPEMKNEDMKAIYGTKNSSGNTLLHLSADSGNVEMVRMFIKHGCPFNSRNNENNTPKDLAQKNSHKDVVEFILSIENSFSAIQGNKTFEIEQIFEEHPKATDENGKMMLHWAAANGNIGITEFLIKNGVDINEKDYSGWTPLHYAVKNDKLEIVKLLLYHDAEFNPINRNRKSPLQVATGKSLNFLQQVNDIFTIVEIESSKNAIECLKLMKRNNYEALVAAINCKYFGFKLFNYVISGNDLELALLLLQNGAGYDIEYMERWGKEISTMLSFIYQLFTWEKQLIYSHNTIESCPIKLEVIRKCRDTDGNTILHKAAKYPINYCRLKFLIKHGANVNTINKKGETVLDKAIEFYKNLDLVKFLLKHNVNVNKLTPNNKQKLIKLADDENRPDIVDLFSTLEKL